MEWQIGLVSGLGNVGRGSWYSRKGGEQAAAAVFYATTRACRPTYLG